MLQIQDLQPQYRPVSRSGRPGPRTSALTHLVGAEAA
jgi:hypothetical protein